MLLHDKQRSAAHSALPRRAPLGLRRHAEVPLLLVRAQCHQKDRQLCSPPLKHARPSPFAICSLLFAICHPPTPPSASSPPPAAVDAHAHRSARPPSAPPR